MSNDHLESQLSKLDAAQTALNESTTKAVSVELTSIWSPELIRFLSTSILAFTLATLILATILLWRSQAPALQVLRTLGIITIIGISSLLLLVGYSNDQLTPIVGLFGAISGYLLGKDIKENRKPAEPNKIEPEKNRE